MESKKFKNDFYSSSAVNFFLECVGKFKRTCE